MPRLRKTVDNAELMPWVEIARRLRLPVNDVRSIYDRAMAKLRAACEAEGLDVAAVRAYFKAQESMPLDAERVRWMLNLHYPEHTKDDLL